MTRSRSEDDLAWLGVAGLHEKLQKGEYTATDVTGFFLDRIDRFDPELQSYASTWPERALRSAARLDRLKDQGLPLGPLHGVPIALKDLCDVAGERTFAGTTVLGSSPAPANAEVVDRLEAAGAVLLGKVKMTEGAFVSHHSSVTPPRNPWNVDRWTGISSSGSGVSVAAGLCAAALGTDTGGSIRFPSAACGLAGLKPTHGRVSSRGVFPFAESLDHIGPMARSVEDVARLFSVLCGHDPSDPWSLIVNPPAATASPLLPSARGLRVGVDRRFCEEGVESGIVAALNDALEVLRELGAEIVEIGLPAWDDAIAAWLSLAASEIAAAHAATHPSQAEQYGPDLRSLIEFGRSLDGEGVAKAWRSRQAFSRRLEGCFETVDVLAAPVIPTLFAANTNLADLEATPEASSAIRFVSPFNLSGSPSLTLPCGFDREDAPIGFQLIGRHLEESRLLTLGSAYQTATDWHRRRPGL